MGSDYTPSPMRSTPLAAAALAESILEEVEAGRMPLGGEPLSEGEIATIARWREGGFR